MGAAASVPEPNEIPESDRTRVLGGTPGLDKVAEAIRRGAIRKIVVAVGAGMGETNKYLPVFCSRKMSKWSHRQIYSI